MWMNIINEMYKKFKEMRKKKHRNLGQICASVITDGDYCHFWLYHEISPEMKSKC